MKKQILSAAVVFVALSSKSIFACSPPPSPLYVQPGHIAKIIESKEVFDVLLSKGAISIQKIELTEGGYQIVSNNGCNVKAKVEYAPPESPGMCPRIEGVKILKVSCEK